MKRTLLNLMLAAGMLTVSMNVSAQQLAEGKYYLANIGATFSDQPANWGAGNSWGTQASLLKHPEYVILHPQADGTYQMETQVSNGGTAYYFNGDYMDNGSPMALTIKKISETPLGYMDDEETVPIYAYTVQDPNGNYFGWDGTSTVLGKSIDIDANDINAAWIIASEEDTQLGLSFASAEDPVDATYMILDPNFGRNNRNQSAWQGTGLKKGGDNTNMNTESYMAVFDLSQTLTGVPNGIYKVEAQAAVTFHDNRTIKEYDGNGSPVVYANSVTSDFVEMTTADKLSSQTQLSTSFNAGSYQVEPIYVEVTDGTLVIGAKSDRADIWAVWDNFSLYYYGDDSTIDQVKNASTFALVQDLADQAEELLADVDIDAVKGLLQDAIESAEEVTTLEEALAVIAQLNEAIDRGQANVIAQSVLPKMKAFTESTNFYTEEALDVYYGIPNDRYEDGSLTKAEASALQDPNVATGWRDANRVDDLLMSVWDAAPEQWDTYHVNTWSIEGDTDGSNFRVPFIEYWTGDGESLGAKTLTATLTGLEEGVYNVKSWVRVRIKNDGGDSANGIKLQANDGEAVDVTTGEQVGTTQFRLSEYTAKGTVGSDGVLKVTFDVAAENNISWLSFKNMWYELDPVATGITTVSSSNSQADGVVYNLQGQRVEKAQKGLFIVGGKKVLK